MKLAHEPASFLSCCATAQMLLERRPKDHRCQPLGHLRSGANGLSIEFVHRRIPEKYSHFPFTTKYQWNTNKRTHLPWKPVIPKIVRIVFDRLSQTIKDLHFRAPVGLVRSMPEQVMIVVFEKKSFPV